MRRPRPDQLPNPPPGLPQKRLPYIPQNKRDIDTRGPGRLPAVNVKVYGTIDTVALPMCIGGVTRPGETEVEWIYTDPRFTHDWIRNLPDDHQEHWFFMTCDGAWDALRETAVEIWPAHHVEVVQEGRSGGWAVVNGLPDIESWDAVMFAKWRRFCTAARAIADDIPRAMLDGIYINEFDLAEIDEVDRQVLETSIRLAGTIYELDEGEA